MNTLRTQGWMMVAALGLMIGCASRTQTPGERMLADAGAPVAGAPAEAAPTPEPTAPTAGPVAAAPAPAESSAPAAKPAAPPAAAPAATPIAEAPAAPRPATEPANLPATSPAAVVYVAPDADAAARMRNWKAVISHYQNGNVVAGPTYRILPPPPRNDSFSAAMWNDFLTTALTIPQTLVTPFWIFCTPVNKEVIYHGDQIGPTYTGEEWLPYYTTEKVPGMVQLR